MHLAVSSPGGRLDFAIAGLSSRCAALPRPRLLSALTSAQHAYHERPARLVHAGQGERSDSDGSSQRLAAIVESSDDAIIAKNLDGIITDWNAAAESLFGYAAADIIGKSVMLLIPEDQHDEETIIMERICSGKPIKHFETIRLHKNGEPIVVSLSISPIRDASGSIVGASKIARDVTDQWRSQEQQELLIKEMNHRVKNLFAVVNSVVRLSAKSAASSDDLAKIVSERLFMLARANELTMPRIAGGKVDVQLASLLTLARTSLAPYQEQLPDGSTRIAVFGTDIHCGPNAATAFALMFHEFATNSVKYGALSVEDGRVTLEWCMDGDEFQLNWEERGGPLIVTKPDSEGFGSVLVRATVRGLGGRIEQNWAVDGLSISMRADPMRLSS